MAMQPCKMSRERHMNAENEAVKTSALNWWYQVSCEDHRIIPFSCHKNATSLGDINASGESAGSVAWASSGSSSCGMGTWEGCPNDLKNGCPWALWHPFGHRERSEMRTVSRQAAKQATWNTWAQGSASRGYSPSPGSHASKQMTQVLSSCDSRCSRDPSISASSSASSSLAKESGAGTAAIALLCAVRAITANRSSREASLLRSCPASPGWWWWSGKFRRCGLRRRSTHQWQRFNWTTWRSRWSCLHWRRCFHLRCLSWRYSTWRRLITGNHLRTWSTWSSITRDITKHLSDILWTTSCFLIQLLLALLLGLLLHPSGVPPKLLCELYHMIILWTHRKGILDLPLVLFWPSKWTNDSVVRSLALPLQLVIVQAASDTRGLKTDGHHKISYVKQQTYILQIFLKE